MGIIELYGSLARAPLPNRVVSLKADGNEELLALARSMGPHFGQAAVMVASHMPVKTIRSYWELQIS